MYTGSARRKPLRKACERERASEVESETVAPREKSDKVTRTLAMLVAVNDVASQHAWRQRCTGARPRRQRDVDVVCRRQVAIEDERRRRLTLAAMNVEKMIVKWINVLWRGNP